MSETNTTTGGSCEDTGTASSQCETAATAAGSCDSVATAAGPCDSVATAAGPCEAAATATSQPSTKTAIPSQRVLYFDVLNVVACLGVIFLHCNGIVHTYAPTAAWRQALAVECVCFWPVPIFFMLSGATLLRYRERYSTKEFLKKRFWRVVVPFLAWSLIMLVWKVYTQQMEPITGPRTLFNAIMDTSIMNIYWFFIPLFAIYLAMPVLSCLADGKHDKVLWYAVGVAFICNSLMPCLLPIFGLSWNGNLKSMVLASYLMFPVLGYLLAKTEITRQQRLVIYALGVFGLLFRYFYTLITSDATGELNRLTFDYNYFPGFLWSVAVFVFAKQVRWERFFATEKSQKVLVSLASCSFGVYLIHMMGLYYANLWTGITNDRLIWRTLMPIVIWAVCLAIVWCLKQIPLIKKLVP